MKVTRDIFAAFLECQYKGYLEFRAMIGEGKGKDKSDSELYHTIREQFSVKIYSDLKKVSPNEIITPKANEILKKGHQYLSNVKCQTDNLATHFDVLMCVPKESLLGDFRYEPILFVPTYKLHRTDKLVLIFDSLVLSELQGKQPEYGYIVFGSPIRTRKIRIIDYIKEAQKKFRTFQGLLSRDDTPELILNNHCGMCVYKKICYEEAKQKDYLSLLSGITVREIAKLKSRGIFTVNQLSYTFRPRRRRKKAKSHSRKYYYSLKALAIRQNTVYIVERPEIATASASIYMDFEGDPDRGLIYLLGFIVDNGQSLDRFSFWVDEGLELKKIAREFLSAISRYDNAAIYHYGKYETKALSSLRKKVPKTKIKQINDLKNKCTNVLSLIHGAIYFPTYGNSLKEIGNCLSFKWTIENASGLNTIDWRREWEKNKSPKLKDDLIRYNIEDCLALRRLVQFISSLSTDGIDNWDEKLGALNVKYDFDDEIYRRRYGDHEFGRIKYAVDDYRFINKRAYFEYQKNRIILRSNKTIKAGDRGVRKMKKRSLKYNKEIKIRRSRICPNCKSKNIKDRAGQNVHSKIVVDLKFFKGGVKKWIVKYNSIRRYCIDCRRAFFPKRYKLIRGKYGLNLIAWVIYQNVVNKVSFDKIRKTLFECYQLDIGFSCSSIYDFKLKAAKFYQRTYTRLISQIKDWHVLYVDETRVSIRGETGYVWVLTNMEIVVFFLKKTRETKFLFPLLKNFEGVIVSDFYKGYDAMECEQQKCLVHLMRDINRDLFKHQQDEELKYVATKFGALLRSIVETADRYGLKKRHLRKHNKGVERFYTDILKKEYDSRTAYDLVKRFERHRNNLFTFLNHDRVAWNNNNAEHAMKHFATYRKNVDGTFTWVGLERYLVLLSLYETCQYRDISFLGFLLSQEEYIDNYLSNYTPSGKRKRLYAKKR